MSIVVSHQPDLAVTSELAYQSGKGQYNQWLAQFQQQQENQKTQALLGGFGAGSRLGLGIANMQSRERMQTERLAQGTAKAAVQLEEDAQWSTTMAESLVSAQAMRHPTDTSKWRKILTQPIAEQKRVLKWADDVAKNRAMNTQRNSTGAVSARVRGMVANGQAMAAGDDAYRTQRQSIDHEFKKGNIDAPTRDRMHKLVARNARMFGNKPIRPETADERRERSQTGFATKDGGYSEGIIDSKGDYREISNSPSKQERMQARSVRMTAAAATVKSLNDTINNNINAMQPDLDQFDNEKKKPQAVIDSLTRQNEALEKLRDRVIKDALKADTGFIEDLPQITQNWMSRLAENPNFESESQREYFLLLQRLSPDKYVLDDPRYQQFRMGQGRPEHRWDNGSADPVTTFSDAGRAAGRTPFTGTGTPSRTDLLRGYYQQDPGATVYDRGMGALNRPPAPPMPPQPPPPREEPWPEDPPAPPMARDIGPPPLDPPPPPMPQDIIPPQTGGGRPVPEGWRAPMEVPTEPADPRLGLSQADRAREAVNIPGRLEPADPGFQKRHLREAELIKASDAARRSALKQAYGEHVNVKISKKKAKRDIPGQRRQPGRTDRRPAVLGEVEAITPRPERLTKAAAGLEVELDRLYMQFPLVKDRTAVRYIQSMLRKYGYDNDARLAQSSPHETAAWNEAMKRMKQLKDALKRRR